MPVLYGACKVWGECTCGLCTDLPQTPRLRLAREAYATAKPPEIMKPERPKEMEIAHEWVIERCMFKEGFMRRCPGCGAKRYRWAR